MLGFRHDYTDISFSRELFAELRLSTGSRPPSLPPAADYAEPPPQFRFAFAAFFTPAFISLMIRYYFHCR
jgi:hypothetical protein